MLRKVIGIVGGSIAVLALASVGFVWWYLQPHPDARQLPSDMVSVTDHRGRALLQSADATADFALLSEHFEAQQLKSYCGVASSVIVLSALGSDVTQQSFFNEDADRVRSRLAVMLGGMTLSDLGELLRVHGAVVSIHHADSFALGQFRETIVRNLSQVDDFLLVNYQREVLGQTRVGHISPLAAFDSDSDLVMVMDTASHYYPHSWVSLEKLYAAMSTIDSASGKMRGYLVVTESRESM